MKKRFIFSLVVIAFCFCELKAGPREFLDLRIPEFAVQNSTMEHAVALLYKWNIQVCLEKVPVGVSTEVTFSLELKDASIRDVLDELVLADPRYYWELHTGHFGIVNVLPLRSKSDPDNLMNVVVNKAVLIDTTPENAISQVSTWIPELGAKLHPGGIAGSTLTGTGPKVVSFTLHARFQDMTVREILNELSSRVRGLSWIYERREGKHTWRPVW